MKIRPSVQAVIFDENKRKFLLIKQFDKRKKRYLWRLVKGGIEKNETEEQAVKREIQEEVGLKKIEIVGKIYEYEYIFPPRKFIVFIYLVKADMEEKVVLEFTEEDKIKDFVWVSKDQAIEMLYWKDEKQSIKLSK